MGDKLKIMKESAKLALTIITFVVIMVIGTHQASQQQNAYEARAVKQLNIKQGSKLVNVLKTLPY